METKALFLTSNDELYILEKSLEKISNQIYKFLKKYGSTYDIICCESGTLNSSRIIHDIIKDFDYCAFNSWDNIDSMKYMTMSNGKTILYLDFDTESG